MSFFPDQHFSIPVTPSPLLCAPGHSGTTLGLPSVLEALATTSHPPAEFPFWVTPSVHTTPPWVTHSDKSSHRHAIFCRVVGLAWALGGFLLSSQHFFPHPQLTPATTKPPTMLPTHTCASPHWSLRVFCAPLECPC